jgi:RHS repeat-associated protein
MEDGATGLTYMKARYYDPVAMRFLSPDPVYVDLVTGGNFNRYWYANNNPYTYTDTDGRQALRPLPIPELVVPPPLPSAPGYPDPSENASNLNSPGRALDEALSKALMQWVQTSLSANAFYGAMVHIAEAVGESEASPTGTRTLGELETIHVPGHPQNDPDIERLSDRELGEAINRPKEGDRITVRGNRVLDGNTRINEAKARGWPSDTIIPVVELPQRPANVDDHPLGPFGDF